MLKCKTDRISFFRFHFSLLILLSFNPRTFKFIQLSLFHQLLLYVMINFPIFKIFLQIFLIKKYFSIFFSKILTKVDENALIK